MIKAKWLGYPGCVERIKMEPRTVGPVFLPAATFPAGKEVDVPDAYYGVLSGNPLFEVTAPPAATEAMPVTIVDKDGEGKGGKGGK